ncbi:MAG: hypothetical protein EBS90_08800, partial [Betaproteobacteria bacterium]|nr:hypothetical protein [Betaproteobacteria bacterium]
MLEEHQDQLLTIAEVVCPDPFPDQLALAEFHAALGEAFVGQLADVIASHITGQPPVRASTLF